MKTRFARSARGVSLLEIMLVLAIAAMIIVLSIRYYQSATTSQQVNTTMSQIQAITSAADNLSLATGSYTAGGVSTGSIQGLIGANSMTAPWGGAITISSVSASTYTVSIASPPTGVCSLITSKLETNNHYTDVNCAPNAALSYTYKANP